MPHVVFRGITTEQLKRISKPLVEELAEICECGTDNFTLELPSSTFVFNGEEIEAFPLIEVKWFERGQEIRDRFAKAITTCNGFWTSRSRGCIYGFHRISVLY